MLTFGVLEVIFIWWGLSYIYLRSNQNNQEYIMLNENQFNTLQQTLQERNVLPDRLCVNRPSISEAAALAPPPPLYQDNVHPPPALPPSDSIQETSLQEQISNSEIDEDAKLIN